MVLHLRQPAPGNWEHAWCRGTVCREPDGTLADPFFEGDEDEAVRFCRGGCPLIEACLSFAAVNNERYGVWGGTTELERRAIRRRWPLKGREPRPEWRLFEPGEPLTWFTPAELELADDDDEEDDDDDDSP